MNQLAAVRGHDHRPVPARSRRCHEDAVACRVQSEVARERRRGDGLGDVVLIRTVLMDHRQRAVSVRRKHVRGRGIVCRTIDTRANGRGGDDRAGLGKGFGLLGDPKPPERNRPTPAFQYRTQRGIRVRLKPLSLTRPTARLTTS